MTPGTAGDYSSNDSSEPSIPESSVSESSVSIVLIQRYPANPQQSVQGTLVLTAEERQRSRAHYQTEVHEQAETRVQVLLNLPRGTVLAAGDLLTTEAQHWWVRVAAKAELILDVQGNTPLDLLKAAYHLGNRHVPVELMPQGLRLATDPVLRDLLEHLGLRVAERLEPFYPEAGAYGHSHATAHTNSHTNSH